MGRKKEPETALQRKEEEKALSPYELALADYSPEELEEIQSSTGLDDIPEEDRRPPLYAWNLDMRDERGNDVKPDMFYNCQNGETQAEVSCALIFLKKTREFSDYDEESRTKNVYCRSWDMKLGMPLDEKTVQYIDCERCRHNKGRQGKRKDCTIVLRFLAFDLEKQTYFVFSAQRTSFIPMMRYLESTFFGQIKQGLKRFDIPLYMINTRLQLREEMGRGKRYYVLYPEIDTRKFENGILPKEWVLDFRTAAESAKKIRRKDLETDEPQDLKYANDPVEETAQKGGQDELNPPPIADDDIPF